MTTATFASAPVSAPDNDGDADEARRVASIIEVNEGRCVRAFGNEIAFKLTGEQTGGAFTLGLAAVPVGNGPPPHVHEREDEMFIIAEGRYRVYLDGTWTEVGPGTVVYLPRGSEHTFQAVGEGPGKHWVLTTPSGFDRFYAKAAELFAAPGPPDFAKLARINAEFGYRLAASPPGAAK
jgi:quercetin dioxygenase-like cupin family protein